MKTELRFDRAPLGKPVRTPQGFLRVPGQIARAGIYEYRRADGSTRRELKPPEVLRASLDAYDSLPITNGHPRRADGEPEEVTAGNVRTYEVGNVAGAARADGDVAEADLVIKDAATIRDVEAGRRELSPGYRVDLEETPGADKRWAYPGNPEGRWDAVQRRIEPNHLAIVDRARGGSLLRLRMDAAEEAIREDAVLTAEQRHALAESSFAVPTREGLPIQDHEHLVAAMARFGQYAFADAAERQAAYARILKRAKALGVDPAGFIEKWSARLDENGRLTTLEAGHQHLIETEHDGMQCQSGQTRWALSEGADREHAHDWVRNPDGSITIGAAEGHSHGIIDDARIDSASRAGQFDRLPRARESERMAEANPNDPAERLRLQIVRADEAERLAAQRNDALTTATRDLDGARAELATAKERIATLEARLAAGAEAVETQRTLELQKRADAAEHQLAELKRQQPEMVRARAMLVTRVQAVMGPDFRADALDERALAATAIKRLRPKEDTSDAVTTEYLVRRLDSLIDDKTRHDASIARASTVLATRTDATDAAKPAVPWSDQWKRGAGEWASNRPKEG